MTSSDYYDAIIVGARAAGAATAMLLARRGLRVLAVDRTAYGSDTLSTHALMRTGVVLLHRWGLLDRVEASGAPPVRQVTFRYPDETVPVGLAASGGVDALYAPRRTVLDSLLADAAREAGAEIRHGVVVDDLVHDADGRVTGIAGRDRTERAFEIRGGLVIGADGMRSLVARRTGARVLWQAPRGGAVVYAYFEGVEAAGFEWIYAPGVSAGIIPTNDGQVCVFVAGAEADFRARVFPDLDGGFHQVLAQASPQVADRVSAGRRMASYRGFAGVHGYVRQAHGAGWALVGDAGYFKDPITTHGISDAFRDAELLSRAVIDGTGLDRYQAIRDVVSHDLFEVTGRIAAFDWSMDEIRRHLRDVSRAMKAELALIDGFRAVAAA